MKKYYFLVALLIASFACSTVIYGNDLYSTANSTKINEGDAAVEESSTSSAVEGDKSASESSTSKVEEKKEEAAATSSSSSDGSLTGTAYVGVHTYLNLRESPWGTIIGKLYNNEEVTITGSDGAWYSVTTSKGSGYVHSNYIFSSKDQKYTGAEPTQDGSSSGAASNVVLNVSGDSLQGKIISAAQQLVNNYSTKLSFPYHPSTAGKSGLGSLGCAQVATTALVAAGALDGTKSYGGLAYASLSCWETVGLLEKKGWSKVQVPPYQAGDVILWNTTGKEASHIGIIMESGNNVKAMSNSSTYKIPRTHSATYSKVSFVMRKA